MSDFSELSEIPRVDTSFRYRALDDASYAMETIFNYDLHPVINGPEHVVALAMDGELDVQLESIEHGQLVAERPNGSEFTLALVDLESMRRISAAAILIARSESYIQGRNDQLHDLFGSNEVRAVKAKDLGKVYDDASALIDGDLTITEGGKANYLSVAKQLRGMLSIAQDSEEPGTLVISAKKPVTTSEEAK